MAVGNATPPYAIPDAAAFDSWMEEDVRKMRLHWRQKLCTTFRLLQKGAVRFPVVRQWLWDVYACLPSSEAVSRWTLEAAEREEAECCGAALSSSRRNASDAWSSERDRTRLKEGRAPAVHRHTDHCIGSGGGTPHDGGSPASGSDDHRRARESGALDIGLSSDAEDMVALRNRLLQSENPPPRTVLPPLFAFYVLIADVKRRQISWLLPLLAPHTWSTSTRFPVQVPPAAAHASLEADGGTPHEAPWCAMRSAIGTQMHVDAPPKMDGEPHIVLFSGWTMEQVALLRKYYFDFLLASHHSMTHDAKACVPNDHDRGFHPAKREDAAMPLETNIFASSSRMGEGEEAASRQTGAKRSERRRYWKRYKDYEEVLWRGLAMHLTVQLRRCCYTAWPAVRRRVEGEETKRAPWGERNAAGLPSCHPSVTSQSSTSTWSHGTRAMCPPWNALEHCLDSMQQHAFTTGFCLPHPVRREKEQVGVGHSAPAVGEGAAIPDCPNGEDERVTRFMARQCWRGILPALTTSRKGVLSTYIRTVLQPVPLFLLSPSHRQPLWGVYVPPFSPAVMVEPKASNVDAMEWERRGPHEEEEEGSHADEQDVSPVFCFLPSFRQLLDPGECGRHHPHAHPDPSTEAVPGAVTQWRSAERKDGVPPSYAVVHPGDGLLCSSGPPVWMALALREPVAHLILMEHWWLLAVTAAEEGDPPGGHTSALLASAMACSASSAPLPLSASTEADDRWRSYQTEREEEWEWRVTAVLESFRCASLVGIRPHWSSDVGGMKGGPPSLDGRPSSAMDSPTAAVPHGTCRIPSPSPASVCGVPASAASTTAKRGVTLSLKSFPCFRRGGKREREENGGGLSSRLPPPSPSCHCFWSFVPYAVSDVTSPFFSDVSPVRGGGSTTPTAAKGTGEEADAPTGRAAVLAFSPSRYVGLEESLGGWGMPASTVVPTASPPAAASTTTTTPRETTLKDRDAPHAFPRERTVLPLPTRLPLLAPNAKKTSGETEGRGGPSHTIRLSFLHHDTAAVSSSPVTATTTTPAHSALLQKEAHTPLPSSSSLSPVVVGETSPENKAKKHPLSDLPFPPSSSSSSSLPSSVTLSQCLKEVQHTVTSSLRPVILSVLHDAVRWWRCVSDTPDMGKETLLEKGSGRIRLYWTPSFAAPIRRVLALRTQCATTTTTTTSSACPCTRITTEALLATCLSFCAYAIPRWLLEGILQVSRLTRSTSAGGGPPPPLASSSRLSDVQARTDGAIASSHPPVCVPENARESAAAAASFPSLVALAQEVLCRLSFVKESVREPTDDGCVDSRDHAVHPFSSTLPPLPASFAFFLKNGSSPSSSIAPSWLELKILHHLLDEMYRVVRRLCEVWRWTSPSTQSRPTGVSIPPDADRDAGDGTWSLLQCAPSPWFADEKPNAFCADTTEEEDLKEAISERPHAETLGMASAATNSPSAETTIASGVARSIENRFLSTILVCIENWANGVEKEVALKSSDDHDGTSLEKWREELRRNLELWKTLFFPSRVRQ